MLPFLAFLILFSLRLYQANFISRKKSFIFGEKIFLFFPLLMVITFYVLRAFLKKVPIKGKPLIP